MQRLVVAGALGVVVGFAGMLFLLTVRGAVWGAPDSALPAAAVAQEAGVASSSPPVRLRIPSLGVNAAVQHAGVTAAGNMAAPTYYADVAWFKFGPAPGARGSAVIGGHVNTRLTLPAVFSRLHELQVGAEVEVLMQNGSTTRFVVERTARYPYNDAPTDDIFRTTGPARLVLITCGGTWLPKEKTYDERLVVYARLAP